MNQPSDAPAPGEYTIDELAAKTGVPSRTIRFYQAKGVLPPPRKRGRVAMYDESHCDRLRVVGELQDKGLRLRAIRDLVTRSHLDSKAIHTWLGISERLGSFAKDAPQLVTEEELKHLLGDPPPGVMATLLRARVIEPHGEGLSPRYLIASPALLTLGAQLHTAGIDIEIAIHLHEVLQRRFARAADEVVEYAIAKIGQGFARSAQPEDVMAALETLFRAGVGAEAARLIFARELERAVHDAVQRDGPVPPAARARRRRR
jgi:DNA-binding transcriptional MerR regulator